MTDVLTWPLCLSTFGGREGLTQRVEQSQQKGYDAVLEELSSAMGTALRVTFIREGFSCLLTFSGHDLNQPVLRKATLVSCRRGKRYSALSVDVGRTTAKIAVAFDNRRAYSLRIDTLGVPGYLALPFDTSELEAVPVAAIRSFALNGGILSSWFLLCLTALCRAEDNAVHEVLRKQDKLRQDMLRMFNETTARYRLRLGSGRAAIALPGLRPYRRDA